jgi:galactitol-specific phosphotransferase system IIB component
MARIYISPETITEIDKFKKRSKIITTSKAIAGMFNDYKKLFIENRILKIKVIELQNELEMVLKNQ